MNRFMGLMPTSEVKITKHFIDDSGKRIAIQAGEKGWTIIFADHSTKYKNVENTTLSNLNEAVDTLKTLMEVSPIPDPEIKGEVISD